MASLRRRSGTCATSRNAGSRTDVTADATTTGAGTDDDERVSGVDDADDDTVDAESARSNAFADDDEDDDDDVDEDDVGAGDGESDEIDAERLCAADATLATPAPTNDDEAESVDSAPLCASSPSSSDRRVPSGTGMLSVGST